jgi:hypothetical protein
MTRLIEEPRVTSADWRAGNQEHLGGVVLVWKGHVYGWKNELRDPASERPGVYAVDKAGLVFKAEGAGSSSLASGVSTDLRTTSKNKL